MARSYIRRGYTHSALCHYATTRHVDADTLRHGDRGIIADYLAQAGQARVEGDFAKAHSWLIRANFWTGSRKYART